ncbi:hypothetical protein KUTeg_009167 [Tegillarca granosa]|uniref:Uncharacterized protein n=1 Tax=Tegillarca granosa TaxID=220873 RepID=A0ABQ9F7C4_TEGGR|nr:hypothetical protein KUTeg_009167 [Tegillarca granosa]
MVKYIEVRTNYWTNTEPKKKKHDTMQVCCNTRKDNKKINNKFPWWYYNSEFYHPNICDFQFENILPVMTSRSAILYQNEGVPTLALSLEIKSNVLTRSTNSLPEATCKSCLFIASYQKQPVKVVCSLATDSSNLLVIESIDYIIDHQRILCYTIKIKVTVICVINSLRSHDLLLVLVYTDGCTLYNENWLQGHQIIGYFSFVFWYQMISSSKIKSLMPDFLTTFV